MKKSFKKIISPYGIYGLMVFLLLGLSSFSAAAQGNVISGKVVSSDGMGIPGANVVQKGLKNGVMTNMDGEFTIKLLPGSTVLVFSYVGYLNQSVDVKGKSKINVTLKSDAKELDEVVVIGYGTAKKRDVLGAVGSVKSERIVENTPTDAVSALQGQVAGVNVVSNGGPGEGSEITIRGLSTFNAGVAPLFVVDGQQMDNINNIDPSSIASMEVLKDGASAAIYGSKSANGVVLITTKTGKTGKPKIEFNYATKISEITSKIPVSNTKQRLKWDKLRQGTVFNDSLSYRTQLVTDVQDLMYQTAISTQANLGVSGGNDNAKYFWNTAVLDETGVFIGTGFRRGTSSVKLDINLSKNFVVGTRTNVGYSIAEGRSSFALREASYRRPDWLIYDYDGSYMAQTGAFSNPVAIALESINTQDKYSLNSYNYLEFGLLTPGLKFKGSLAFNYLNQQTKSFRPLITQNIDTGRPSGNQSDVVAYDYQQENYFTYNRSFGKHTVSGLLGMSNQKWETETGRYTAIEFNNELIWTFNNVKTLDLSRTDTFIANHSLSSFFGRATYDYDGKYLFAATMRRDGSSRFGEDTKWGNFPSVSLGWRLNKEKFLNKLLGPKVSEVKLRASYAVTGNERIGDYDALLLLSPGSYYNGVNGFAPTNEMGNSALGWESTTSINFGLDLSFFKKRLNFVFDIYDKTTDDLLYDVPVPQETGFSSVKYNIGSVQNRGYELEISGTPISTKNFKWNSTFNIGYNENVVTDLADDDGFFTGNYKIEEGQPIGNIYGYTFLNVYAYDQSNAYANVDGKYVQLTPVFDLTNPATPVFQNYTLNGEVYTGTVAQKTGTAGNILKGGDVNFADLNNDLKLDDLNDRSIVGNGLSKYTGSFYNKFDYKNWSLGFQFYYNFGNDIYREYDWYRNRSINATHVPGPTRIDQAWAAQGDVTDYPHMSNTRNWNSPNVNSFYMDSGDYIRLRFIKLSYSLDKETIKKIKFLEYLNFSFTVNNVVTWTSYQGYNPEFGSGDNPLQPGWDGLRYPNKSDFIFGISTRF